MLEKKFQTQFKHYLGAHWKTSAVFELKQTKTDTLRKDALAPHQRQALLNTKHRTLYHKLADNSFLPLPFDCFFLAGVPAFVVVKFKSGVVLIDIDKMGGSLTYEQAIIIGKRLW